MQTYRERISIFLKDDSGTKLRAWAVHLLTATGAIFGFWALHLAATDHTQMRLIFVLLFAQIAVDAVDGTFARRLAVTEVLPQFDGALLDNIVDYLTYVVVPAMLLYTGAFVPVGAVFASAILVASAYQFCQREAKTTDHFFLGFPSLWSIVVFYMWIFNTSQTVNTLVLITALVLVFVPIKYLYPSRLESVSDSGVIRSTILALSLLWGVCCALLLVQYPNNSTFASYVAWLYPVLYLLISLQCTFRPQTVHRDG